MNFKDSFLSAGKFSEHSYRPVTLLRASARDIEEFGQQQEVHKSINQLLSVYSFSSAEPMNVQSIPSKFASPTKLYITRQILTIKCSKLFFFKELRNSFQKCLQAQHYTMTTAKQLQQQQQPRRIKQRATIYKQLALKEKSKLPHNQLLKKPIKQCKSPQINHI